MAVPCYRCGESVKGDTIGLNKKMVNRAVQQYLCMRCLAEHFHVTEQELRTMIDHFRKAGCTLFPPEN